MTVKSRLLELLEQQKEALEKMADDYVKLDETKYKKWKEKILQGIQEL